MFAGQDENAGKPLLKLGIILPQTQWKTKIRSYLNIISNSLEDLDQVMRIFCTKFSNIKPNILFTQTLKKSLNKRYKFVSKILDLHDENDSVNFDGIVAVSPPPMGEYWALYIGGRCTLLMFTSLC